MTKNINNKYDDFGILTNHENLYNAHRSCRKGKRWKDSVAIYDIRALECTLALSKLLKTGRYHISPYHCFTVNERGKERQIKSTKYHDRVVQKALIENILYPSIVPSFIYDNGASQNGKGTDFALDRLERHLQEYVRKHGSDGFVLICDGKDYFNSLQHELLNLMYSNYFSDEWIMALIIHIHNSIPGGVGVPLGNQLSQLDALMALNPVDHIIKERLHTKYYGRYNDDFYLIHNQKEYLKQCKDVIEKEVNDRGIELNKKKTRIVTLRQGFNFLGFHFYVTETGKVVRKLRTKSKVRIKQKLRKLKKKLDNGETTIQSINQSYDAWRAHAQRGDTYYLIRNMDKYYAKVFGQPPNPIKKKRR